MSLRCGRLPSRPRRACGRAGRARAAHGRSARVSRAGLARTNRKRAAWSAERTRSAVSWRLSSTWSRSCPGPGAKRAGEGASRSWRAAARPRKRRRLRTEPARIGSRVNLVRSGVSSSAARVRARRPAPWAARTFTAQTSCVRHANSSESRESHAAESCGTSFSSCFTARSSACAARSVPAAACAAGTARSSGRGPRAALW